MKQARKKFKLKKKSAKVIERNITYRILIEPIITEAASIAVELNKYTFKVATDATKTQIKAAIQDLYKVKVKAVNTLNTHRKPVSYGKTPGFKAASKKAVVTLVAGESIELFKGA